MTSERTAETEAQYAQGLAFLRTAQWSEAVQVFSALRATSSAYPEIDALIADALLKIEIERAKMPEGAPPPKSRRVPWAVIGVAAIALAVAAGGTFFVLRAPAPQLQPTPAVIVAAVPPTSRPTSTPAPSPTPRPTSTPAPSPTPQSTAVPEPGTITVRMAQGQALTRTIGIIEIILDASGSMLAQIDGQRKIDIAHESLARLVGQLPDTTNVALRAYGHRRPKDCNDIELLAPLARLDRAAFTARINAVTPAPNGMTPIGLSLQQVADDLKGTQGDMLVVLVSDGEETCDSDPAQIAAQLHANNPKLRIDVIGFNVGPEDLRNRLSAIATGGGGTYFDAGDASQLAAALQQAVKLSFRVLDARGAEVYQGALGSSAKLPAGRYSVVIGGDQPLAIGDLDIGGGASVSVELREQDGALKAAVIP